MAQLNRKAAFWVMIGVLVFFFLGFFLYLSLLPTPGRTNLLFLGITGKEHVGGDLTDTIIFISCENQTGKVLAFSLPRDIWVASMRAKLNSAYHYGGLDLAKSVVSKILDQPINHSLVVDSSLFVKIIDVLGGVEVEVERSFDDYKYPIPGRENDPCGNDPEYKCRYEHIHFDAGKQHMDGERALKYVRSRFAEGEEGTDFARSKRQQRLVLALKNKILSPQVLLNPQKPLQLFKVFVSNIETDIPQEKYFDLLKTAFKFRSKNLKMITLDENFLINPPVSEEKYDDQWVLVPKGGSWEEVQEYIRELLGD